MTEEKSGVAEFVKNYPSFSLLYMRVDDAKTLDFLKSWLRAGLAQVMEQAGIDCEISETGNVSSVVIRPKA